MTEDLILQFLHNKELLTASFPASTESKLAFLGVYPIDPSWPSTIARLRRLGISTVNATQLLYRICAFEIDRELLDIDEYPSEETMNSLHDTVAIGDDDLRTKLKSLGLDLTQLDLPSKSNYPL